MKKSRMGYAYQDAKTGKWMWKQLIRREWKEFTFIKRLEVDTIAEEFEMIAPVVDESAHEVTVPEILYDEILDDFIPRWKAAKIKEGRFAMDSGSMVNRATTGFLGEAAIEILLGIPVLDRDKDGKIEVKDSRKFRGADLVKTGLDVGVKTVEWGKFPVIKRNVRRPQMIGFKIADRTFLVGSFATMKVLRECQSSLYIIDENLRNKRTYNGQIEKIAFWGFHRLQRVASIDDLKKAYHRKGR